MSDLPVIPSKRHELVLADHNLKSVISQHGNYVDKTGSGSSNPAGLIKTINTKILEAFGGSRATLDYEKSALVLALVWKISEIILAGESRFMTRREIKDLIYQTIDKYGELARSE